MIERGEVEVGGARVAYRRCEGEGDPVVFVHGNPSDSRQWLPYLERIGGPAIALDLPGFGASDRPSATRFDYSMHGLARAFGGFLDAVGIGSYRLAVQDWGALALIEAAREPERVRRLVVFDAVPLLPGYRWHRVAQVWRRRRWGELQLRSIRRWMVALGMREARHRYRAVPTEFLEMIWSNLGHPRTQEAILALYRSADPRALAAAGEPLGDLRCPALVIWGASDPYLPTRFAAAYAERLPGAGAPIVHEDAGHWPWLDRPDVVDRTLRFLADLDSDS